MNLEDMRNEFFPYKVKEAPDLFIIIFGTIDAPMQYAITKAAIGHTSDVGLLLKGVKKLITRRLEELFIKEHYNSVIDNPLQIRTLNGEIVLVDTIIPTNTKLLVISPEVYADLMLSGDAKHINTGNRKRKTPWKDKYKK